MSHGKALQPKGLRVDETAYRKGHACIMVGTDQEPGIVLHVVEDCLTTSRGRFYEQLDEDQPNGTEEVYTDMWPAYIKATRQSVQGAGLKVAFVRFHVAQYLGKGVDQVRRDEHRQLLKAGDQQLKGTKYQWLRNPTNMGWHPRRALSSLKQSSLKSARAWAMKEFVAHLWRYEHQTWALKGWKRLLTWVASRRLAPTKRVAATLKKHLWGIINPVVLRADNSHAESSNSRIKTVNTRARGFHNKQRFRDANYFHPGVPQPCAAGIRQ